MTLSILLCDDHALFREALAALLAQVAGWQVVAQAGDGAEAVRLADAHRPDVAVLDVAMPGMGGIDAAKRIRAVSPATRVIALSMYADAHYRQGMASAGAVGYVLKNEAGAELVSAIRAVIRGETYVSALLRDAAPAGLAIAPAPDLACLTGRERDVLRLLAQGGRTKDIAATLGISAKTVETYRGRVMLKLGIDNLAGLVKCAIRAGIVGVD